MGRDLVPTVTRAGLSVEAVSDTFLTAVVPTGLATSVARRARDEAAAFLPELVRRPAGAGRQRRQQRAAGLLRQRRAGRAGRHPRPGRAGAAVPGRPERLGVRGAQPAQPQLGALPAPGADGPALRPALRAARRPAALLRRR